MQAAFAAVDWGTSSFRLWLIDAAGAVLAERRSDEGMLNAGKDGFAAILERHLSELSAPPELPVIICGMAGARQGWLEAPYVPVPAKLDDILAGAVTIPARREIRILPGLAQRAADRPDVMRGEETQLAGILPLLVSGDHLVCMPGTHSKWVQASEGVIVGFRTWLTGELFSVLSKQSILRHSFGEHQRAAKADDPAFQKSLATAFDLGGDFGRALFSIRAGTLLHDLSADDAAATLSGLLVGAEIASARAAFDAPDRVILVGSGTLGLLYRAALERDGFTVLSADADEAVRAGLVEAARRLGWIERKIKP